ncbi:exostosin family protein [Flavobacterium sp.]|uniref:exostosin domain-containing protein n=1 Tax=Flavobacterium sp. TaxID=239 RepID=UPI0035286A6A
MQIFIPNINFETVNNKSLFILTRPFLGNNCWENNEFEKNRWNVSNKFVYESKLEKATVFFIPLPIQTYTQKELIKINTDCEQYKIKAFGYISDDFGPNYGNFEHIIFYRMSGFASQLGCNNKGFPVMLSDHFERIYQQREIFLRSKNSIATIGFCGHASNHFFKRTKENIKVAKENINRFIKNPFRNDYEPIFPSAFERYQILQQFEKSNKVKSNFIYRENYRGGAITIKEREKTTKEYYNNIKNSDYVLCMRGAGNFSVRFYETLMMGRIPIFLNTDCLLPFDDSIDWKDHVVWVEWENRNEIATLVADFHQRISEDKFAALQLRNRELWKETLQVSGIMNLIKEKYDAVS